MSIMLVTLKAVVSEALIYKGIAATVAFLGLIIVTLSQIRKLYAKTIEDQDFGELNYISGKWCGRITLKTGAKTRLRLLGDKNGPNQDAKNFAKRVAQKDKALFDLFYNDEITRANDSNHTDMPITARNALTSDTPNRLKKNCYFELLEILGDPISKELRARLVWKPDWVKTYCHAKEFDAHMQVLRSNNAPLIED